MTALMFALALWPLWVALAVTVVVGEAEALRPKWGHPITGHVHTAGMQCRECREASA